MTSRELFTVYFPGELRRDFRGTLPEAVQHFAKLAPPDCDKFKLVAARDRQHFVVVRYHGNWILPATTSA
jgi:hypothetical protein